jgi:hypothetical protein
VAEKSRIRNLSTRYLGLYKYGFVALMGLFGAALVYEVLSSGAFFSIILWGYMIYLWLKAHVKVFRVEFDDEYMYILNRKQDVLIPLENIKDVELKSLSGVWRVDLFYEDVVGNHFYFKPSLLYPLNYKRKDALVDLLWTKIETARGRKQHFQNNALHS